MVIVVVIFAETGLLVGFFLPGDNLILLAGILCKSQPSLLNVDFIPMVILMIIAAVVGNMFGYWFGKRRANVYTERKETLFFRKSI
ncbi:MAG: hypothetical protein IPG08_10230 [Sphingobacteriaceae bacterium]|nr:hypothetical protein [Sphingobacteriaceae bacterium]